MKFSVLINNHNYGRYLVECVESVLQQSHPALEIIVVDDGSTDDSPAILQRHFASNPLVKIMPQRHEGQSCAIATAMKAAQGDIFCLLDSDDKYKSHYLERLLACYQANHSVDFVFCRLELFGENVGKAIDPTLFGHPFTRDYDLGYTALVSYFGSVMWLGNTTSSLSFKRALAQRLDLDYVAKQLNYTGGYGDQAIVTGASLLGGRKFYIHERLVDYRCHSENHWYSPGKRPPAREYRDYLNLATHFEYYKKKSQITEKMLWLLPLELKTVPDPVPEHVALYEELIRKEERRLQELDVQRKGAWSKANQKFRQHFLKKIERTVKKITGRKSRRSVESNNSHQE